ncbi:MAG: nitric oxide reductase NorD protein, partial [Mycobacterium sp.]|nr:nitric oxide reductase NorD protein [Mycobacterium sp.]
RGTGCVCLTIGAETDVQSLRKVFGDTAHATIARPDQLAGVIGPLFRSALRSAEVCRKVSRPSSEACPRTTFAHPPNERVPRELETNICSGLGSDRRG